jgi:phosphate transport system substrate-binding protein
MPGDWKSPVVDERSIPLTQEAILYRFVKKTAIAMGCGALAALLVPAAIAASAAPAKPAKPAAPAVATNFRLNAVGSDTIFCVDNDIPALNGTVKAGIFDKYNATQATTTGNQAVDTAPFGGINVGCATTPLTSTVPGDSVHPALSYSSTGNACAAPLSGVAHPWLYPAGSSAGITCFADDQGAGNVAFARSSRGRKSTDAANLEFWAFALDGVTWTRNAANTAAPASLTAAQITSLYSDNPDGTCKVTNWSQVGGKNGPITRYHPQSGSGTGAFFDTLFLGGALPVSTAACPITFVPENDGTQIKAADLSSAILPYSFAVFTAQSNGTEANLTNGQKLSQVNKVAASKVSEAAAQGNIAGDSCTAVPAPAGFCGSRYVYHVTWDGAIKPPGGFGLPAAYYTATIDLIGVPSSGVAGAHSICANKDAATIKKYGFKPLPSSITSQSTAFPAAKVPGNSFCRLF